MVTNARRVSSVRAAALAVVLVVATALPANAADWLLVGRFGVTYEYLDQEYQICTYCYDHDTVHLQWTKSVPIKGRTAAWRQELRRYFPGQRWTSQAASAMTLGAFDCYEGETAWAAGAITTTRAGRVLQSSFLGLPSDLVETSTFSFSPVKLTQVVRAWREHI